MEQRVISKELRVCECGCKVRYYVVADADSVAHYFTAPKSSHCGPVIKRCPKCKKKLNLEDTLAKKV